MVDSDRSCGEKVDIGVPSIEGSIATEGIVVVFRVVFIYLRADVLRCG